MKEALDVLLQDPDYCHDQICLARSHWGETEEGDEQARKMLGLIAFNTKDLNVKERANLAIKELDLRCALIAARETGTTRAVMNAYLQSTL